MDPNSLKVVDLLGSFVGFLREAGLVGMLVSFSYALSRGWLYWGKDYAKVEQRASDDREELEAERVRNQSLTATVDRLATVLEKATGGLERSVARSIAQDEGIDIQDVLAEMASKKVGAHTRLNYPKPPVPRKARPRSVKSDAAG